MMISETIRMHAQWHKAKMAEKSPLAEVSESEKTALMRAMIAARVRERAASIDGDEPKGEMHPFDACFWFVSGCLSTALGLLLVWLALG